MAEVQDPVGKYNEVLECIKNRDLESVRKLISSDEISNKQLECLVCISVFHSYYEVLLVILTSRNPDLRNQRIAAATWQAVENSRVDIAELLIAAGAPVDLASLSVIKKVRENISQEATDDYWDEEDDEIDNFLIELCASANFRDRYGKSVLLQAVELNMCDVVENLLRKGARIEQDEEASILHAAAKCINPPAMLTPLIQNGLNIHLKDDDGFDVLHSLEKSQYFLFNGRTAARYEHTPLHLAIEFGDFKMVKFLLDLGADVNAKAKFNDLSPLYVAALFKHRSILELLLSQRANIRQKTTEGRTPMHAACYSDARLPSPDEKIIEVLLRHGADINIKDNKGETPLSLLAQNLSPAMKEMLKHIAKLAVKKTKVPSGDLKIVNSNDSLNSFYQSCLSELDSMKKVRVCDTFTYCYILSNSSRKISFLLKNDKVSNAVESYDKELFPLYSSDLDYVVKNAKIYRDKFCETEDKLYCIFKAHLPAAIIENITHFLTNMK